MELNKQAHCVYRCEYHIVWITRFRFKILNKGVSDYLLIKLDEVRKHYPEMHFIERSIQPDHVHLVMTFPPRYSIATVINILKSNTARELRQKFEFIDKLYFRKTGIWSVGYFVSTVGVTEKVVLDYVKRQGEEDLGQAKLALG